MACKGKVLVAVVAVFVGLVVEQQVTFVKGDAGLIVSVCLKASNLFSCDGCDLQKDCGNCFKSTPGGFNMDLKGLGLASINCAEDQSKKALQLANQGWGSYVDDDLQDAYGVCVKDLDPGNAEIMNAIKSFQNGRYADAANKVMAGSPSAVQCISQLKPWSEDLGVVDQVVTLESLRRVSAGVLKQIN